MPQACAASESTQVGAPRGGGTAAKRWPMCFSQDKRKCFWVSSAPNRGTRVDTGGRMSQLRIRPPNRGSAEKSREESSGVGVPAISGVGSFSTLSGTSTHTSQDHGDLPWPGEPLLGDQAALPRLSGRRAAADRGWGERVFRKPSVSAREHQRTMGVNPWSR